jgi:hypothetical protein
METAVNSTGKSYGLFGPSNTITDGTTTTKPTGFGILGNRDQMKDPGCLPKYMAITVIPRNNTVFD